MIVSLTALSPRAPLGTLITGSVQKALTLIQATPAMEASRIGRLLT